MRVIHVPMSEMLWPPKKSLKLRWRRARQACEAPSSLPGFTAPGSSVFIARVVSSAGLKRWHPCA